LLPDFPGGVEQLLTVRQVAKMLRVCPATVYKWVAEGVLPHARIVNVIRIVREDLNRVLAARAPRPPAPPRRSPWAGTTGSADRGVRTGSDPASADLGAVPFKRCHQPRRRRQCFGAGPQEWCEGAPCSRLGCGPRAAAGCVRQLCCLGRCSTVRRKNPRDAPRL